jgi:hypothetical protein
MLSLTDWTPAISVQPARRRPMQLELFALPSGSRPKSPLWDRLSREEQQAVVAALARLLAKAVRPEERRDSDD